MNYITIPQPVQPHTLNYDKWYKLYEKDVRVLFRTLLDHIERNKLPLFDKMEFKDFVKFVYKMSNTRRERFHHILT